MVEARPLHEIARRAELAAEQAIQESEYSFPYHYIPTLENGNFSQIRKLAWGYEYLSYLNFLLRRLESVSFNSLLDVGCGEGRFLSEAAKRFPGRDLLGLDFSARAIDFARLLNPDLKFVCGDLMNGALADEQFDVVTLVETLEHVPPANRSGFVSGLRRHVKQNGLLLLTVPTENLALAPKHYQHFNLSSLRTALEPCFQITEHYFLNRISKWERLLKALLVNRYFILNDQRLLNALYRRYESSLVNAREADAKRICVLCHPR